jgi:hypothetical protein
MFGRFPDSFRAGFPILETWFFHVSGPFIPEEKGQIQRRQESKEDFMDFVVGAHHSLVSCPGCLKFWALNFFRSQLLECTRKMPRCDCLLNSLTEDVSMFPLRNRIR